MSEHYSWDFNAANQRDYCALTFRHRSETPGLLRRRCTYGRPSSVKLMHFLATDVRGAKARVTF
eukprot:7580347-Pyramimonas_sp.AAC.2